MFDIYHKYTPQELKDEIGWKNDVDMQDVTSALMVLCDIISILQLEVAKLKAEKEAAH